MMLPEEELACDIKLQRRQQNELWVMPIEAEGEKPVQYSKWRNLA